MAGIFRRTHPGLAGLGRKSALVDALGNFAQRSLGFLGHFVLLISLPAAPAALGFPGAGKSNGHALLVRAPRFAEFAYIPAHDIACRTLFKWHFTILPICAASAVPKISHIRQN